MSIERLSRANPWLAATLPVGAAVLVAIGRADDASVLVVLWLMLLVLSRIELPAAWRTVITVTVVVEGWAPVLGVYSVLPASDKLIHAWASALVALAGARLLAAVGVLSEEPRDPLRAFALALGLALAVGLVWELYEGTSDLLFGTDLSPSAQDTLTDLAADLVGGLIGATAIAWPKRSASAPRRTTTSPETPR